MMETARIETIPSSGNVFPEPVFRDAVTALNRRLDALVIPYDINESVIEALLETLETADSGAGPAYWLLLARVTELALIAAGHYADHCEFSAAGDLMVNPRTIKVCWKDRRQAAVKDRHERLTDQFRESGQSQGAFVRDFNENGSLEILRPALLPVLFERLAACGRFSSEYLAAVSARMGKVADAIGFLCAGGITTGLQLHLHLKQASASDREFFAAHLCRFDCCLYDRIGREVDRWQDKTLFMSAFLVPETIYRFRAGHLQERPL